MTLQALIYKWHGKQRGAYAALARKVPVKSNVVSQWVRGVGPDEDRFEDIAEILGVTKAVVAAAVKKTKETQYYPIQGQASGLILKLARRVEQLEARQRDLEEAFFRPDARAKMAKRYQTGDE